MSSGAPIKQLVWLFAEPAADHCWKSGWCQAACIGVPQDSKHLQNGEQCCLTPASWRQGSPRHR